MFFCSLDRCSVNTAYHVVFFGQDAASLTSSREQDMVHTQLARKTTASLHTDFLLPSSFFLLQDANILSIVQHAQNGQPVPLVRGVDSDALEDFQSIMGLTCMVKQITTTTTAPPPPPATDLTCLILFLPLLLAPPPTTSRPIPSSPCTRAT